MSSFDYLPLAPHPSLPSPTSSSPFSLLRRLVALAGVLLAAGGAAVWATTAPPTGKIGQLARAAPSAHISSVGSGPEEIGGVAVQAGPLQVGSKELAKVLVKPGRPGLLMLQLPPPTLQGHFCVFSYGKPLDKPTGTDSHAKAWAYGAKIAYESEDRILASPTGDQSDVLPGRLLCWTARLYKAKLKAADKLMTYDPNSFNPGGLRREVISVVLADGSVEQAFWYYQSAEVPGGPRTNKNDTGASTALPSRISEDNPHLAVLEMPWGRAYMDLEINRLSETTTSHPKHPAVAALYEERERLEFGTEECMEKRRMGVTASDVAVIVSKLAIRGENKYSTIDRLLRIKLGQEAFTGNQATAYGQKCEPEAIAAYQQVTGMTVVKEQMGCMFGPPPGHNHSEYKMAEYVGATPDAVLQEHPILIEIKCPFYKSTKFFDQDPRVSEGRLVPDLYYPQVQTQLAVTGFKKAHFVRFRPQTAEHDGAIDITVVNFDPHWWDEAMHAIAAFHARLMHGPPPKPLKTKVHTRQEVPFPRIYWPEQLP